MERPTRSDQARAILHLRGRRFASRVIGRNAVTTRDFAEAFNLERIDLISEIPTVETLLELGKNVVAPTDGLYVLDDGGSYRVYLQERGEIITSVVGASFDEAREMAIDCLIKLNGLPYTPPG